MHNIKKILIFVVVIITLLSVSIAAMYSDEDSTNSNELPVAPDASVTNVSTDEVVNLSTTGGAINVKTPPLSEMVAAKGNANYQKDGNWFEDVNCEIPASDDTDAIQACIDYAYNKKINVVYCPAGNYMTTRPLLIYTNMRIEGLNRETTVIHKVTNTPYNVGGSIDIDAIIILSGKESDAPKGHPADESQSLINIALLGNRTGYVAENKQYGVYCPSNAPFFCIENFKIYDVDIGIELYGSWHSTFRNGLMKNYSRAIYLVHEAQGVQIHNIDAFGMHDVGVEISGSNYGNISALNLEWVSGIGLKTNSCKISIAGMGIERSTDMVKQCIYAENSDLFITDSFFDTNKVYKDYRTFYLTGSSIELKNSSVGFPDRSAPDGVKGRLFEMTFNSKFDISDTTTIYVKFNENSVIGDSSNEIIWNNVKQIEKNVFIGSYVRNNRYTDIYGNTNPLYISKKITLDNKYNPLDSEATTDSNRAYSDAYNKGDWALINNPLKNGHAAYVCPRDNETINYLKGNVIEAGTNYIIVSDLTLDNFETEGGRLYRGLDLVSASGGTGVVAAVDYSTNKITFFDLKGNWVAGDKVSTAKNPYLRHSDWAIVPVILSGTTAQRPTAPVVGQEYFDITLGKPIWCKQIYKVIWVDATGKTV